MSKKLVIFDVDGTIIAGRMLPESTVLAIKRVRENGHTTVFFTGRPYTHVDRRVVNIGFDAAICTMGAYIKIGETVVQDIRPTPDVTQRLIELVRSCGLDAAFESSEGISFDKSRPLPPFLGGLKKSFADRGFETDADIESGSFSFEKLCVWTNENSNLERFEREASDYLDVIGKKQNMAELVAKGVSVKNSVDLVKEHFGAAFEDCFAIGDSISDLPMLSCAAYKMAMGNAMEELKSRVDFVTSDIMDDGLYKAMEHCGLI
ncbi:MAG: HAD hydrolase family protein [Oscillospiraceae bacterium]